MPLSTAQKEFYDSLTKNGDLHPVAFLSESFIAAERNYDIYDCELLAVIRGLKA